MQLVLYEDEAAVWFSSSYRWTASVSLWSLQAVSAPFGLLVPEAGVPLHRVISIGCQGAACYISTGSSLQSAVLSPSSIYEHSGSTVDSVSWARVPVVEAFIA